jgi:hypothetical protein
MQTAAVHAQYLDFGYQPIPLKPASKLPLVTGWQIKPTVRQWHNTPQDVNIGLRAGNGRAFIDCDDRNRPGTFEAVTRWLDGLGYHPGSYPVVQTASGVGRHVYVNWTGSMLGSKRNLSSDLGAGEFRFDYGAYVAAPPSIVDSGTYTLIDGDLLNLPVLDLRAIAQIVNVNADEKMAPSKQPQMSRKAVALANGNADVIGQYPSRSEAEAALVLSLINSGFEYPAIKSIFDGLPCAGKYASMPEKYRSGYLERTYNNALAHAQNESSTRRFIRQLQEAAELAAWKNASDKQVFIAHTEIAYRTGKLTNAAACRDLAIIAGVQATTASNANKRLVADEYLILETEGTANLAHKFTLRDKVVHSLTLSYLGSVQVCPANRFIPDGERISTHDAFGNGKHKLGQRAGQVYELLLTYPDGLTIEQLVDVTGAHIKTVRRALKKLSKVIDEALNLRSGPSISYAVISWLYPGDVLEITQQRDGWANVRTADGVVGWVNQTYCR